MKVTEEIGSYIASQFKTIKALISLVVLESKLAGLSVYPLLVNVCMLFVALTSLWCSLMVLIAYLMVLLLDSYLITLIAIVLLNTIILLSLLKYLSYNLKNMSFEKTRSFFANHESDDYEKLKKTSDCTDS